MFKNVTNVLISLIASVFLPISSLIIDLLKLLQEIATIVQDGVASLKKKGD